MGVEIGAALDKAEITGEDRVFILLEAAYAVAAQLGWSFLSLVERSRNRWEAQVRRDTAGQLIQVVDPHGRKLH